MTDTTPTAGPTLARRQALLAAGALGAAGALAACGGDDPTDTTAPDDAETPGDAADPPDDAGTADPSDDPGEDSGDEGSQPEGDLLASADDVPVGGGVINGDAQVVITQPVEGEFKAFSSTCTHEACQVGDVSDGLIRCFCHGSRYFIADGEVENGPAPRALDEIAITVEDDQILRA